MLPAVGRRDAPPWTTTHEPFAHQKRLRDRLDGLWLLPHRHRERAETNRAAAKRFRKTASGKFKCGHAFKSHILTKKATKRKRGLRATNHVRKEDAGRVARMLPYV